MGRHLPADFGGGPLLKIMANHHRHLAAGGHRDAEFRLTGLEHHGHRQPAPFHVRPVDQHVGGDLCPGRRIQLHAHGTHVTQVPEPQHGMAVGLKLETAAVIPTGG